VRQAFVCAVMGGPTEDVGSRRRSAAACQRSAFVLLGLLRGSMGGAGLLESVAGQR